MTVQETNVKSMQNTDYKSLYTMVGIGRDN